MLGKCIPGYHEDACFCARAHDQSEFNGYFVTLDTVFPHALHHTQDNLGYGAIFRPSASHSSTPQLLSIGISKTIGSCFTLYRRVQLAALMNTVVGVFSTPQAS